VADDVVISALRKAIEKDTELPLVTQGDAQEEVGLFPDRKGPSKKAIQACTEGDKPLLLVREEPGKGKTPKQFARITDKGIVTLVAQTPLKQLPDLIDVSAPSLRTRVIRSCLRSIGRRAGELDPWNHRRLMQTCLKAAQSQYDAIESRLEEVLNEEKLLSEWINDFLKVTRARMENTKQRLNGELDTLAKAATAMIAPEESSPQGAPRRLQLPEWQRVPTTDVDMDFQKNLSEELVFAWQDASSSEVQAGLERALFNVGVERVGDLGEIVEFNGTWHHSADDVENGEPVEIKIPGWQLVNRRGKYLIARAKVAKTAAIPPSRGLARDPMQHTEMEKQRRVDVRSPSSESLGSHSQESPAPVIPGPPESEKGF
jgi:hypothetical protein